MSSREPESPRRNLKENMICSIYITKEITYTRRKKIPYLMNNSEEIINLDSDDEKRKFAKYIEELYRHENTA